MKRNDSIKIAGVSGYLLFVIVSFVCGFNPGKEIGHNFVSFSIDMLKLLPCAFILIGLFEVWVKRETIENLVEPQSVVCMCPFQLRIPFMGKAQNLALFSPILGLQGYVESRWQYLRHLLWG